MILTYAPKDGDRQVWQFKADDMLNAESELIEKRTDWTWIEFLERLQKGSTLARRALLWTLLRRTHATLRFEDVRFAQGELTLDFDADELRALREAVASGPEVSGLNKDLILAKLDQEIAEQEAAGRDPGKAPANSDASATSTP